MEQLPVLLIAFSNICLQILMCVRVTVRRTARRIGLKEASEGEDFNLYWTDCSVTLDRLVSIKPFQVRLEVHFLWLAGL